MTRIGLALLVAACTAIAAAYAVALSGIGPAAYPPWGLALGSAGALTGMMLLGIGGARRGPSLAVAAVVLTGVVVAGCFGWALWRPPAEGAGGALLLGLPVRTAVVLYGVGVIPMLLLPLAYALTFDDASVDADVVARLRAAAPPREGP